jgi:hypothetical protein
MPGVHFRLDPSMRTGGKGLFDLRELIHRTHVNIYIPYTYAKYILICACWARGKERDEGAGRVVMTVAG